MRRRLPTRPAQNHLVPAPIRWLLAACAGLILAAPWLSGRAQPPQQPIDGPAPALLILQADQPALPPATGETRVVATVRDSRGGPVIGVDIQFAAIGGSVVPAVALTDRDGQATVRFISGVNPGAASVTATLGGLSDQVALEITPPLKLAGMHLIDLRPERLSLEPEASTPIVVTLRNAVGQPMAGEALTLMATDGIILPAGAVTDSEGQATVVFQAGARPGVSQITALAGSGAATLQIAVGAGALGPAARSALWVDPPSVRVGQSVEIGALVQREGGAQATPPLSTRFFIGDPATTGAAIGVGQIPPLSPDGGSSTTPVVWQPNAAGPITLYALVAGAGAPPELSGLVISRTLQVLPPAGDLIPPTVGWVTATLGEDRQALQIAVAGADPAGGSGVGAFVVAEQIYDPTTATWRVARRSHWQAMSGPVATLDWPHPSTGHLHEIQVWVRDRAGNISARPGSARVDQTGGPVIPRSEPDWRWVDLPAQEAPYRLYLPLSTP